MLYIQDTLISLDIIEEHFVCDLDACKGACCVQGDYGAPLSKAEQAQLPDVVEKVKPYLTTEGLEVLGKRGLSEWECDLSSDVTPLLASGACAYLSYDGGIAKCGFERAFEAGETDFRKPLSCQLYPIRVSKNEQTGWEAWNYDIWDICSAACSNGSKLSVKIYEFLKEAIIRAKGQDFYDELSAAANHVDEEDGPAR